MHADSTFMIGATHSVCQDYVVARNIPYLILSDGCSTSPDTDIGARLLVKAAEHTRKTFDGKDPAMLHQESARVALSWATSMDLPVQSVDATLLTAFVNGDDLSIGCSGDGVIVGESNDGSLDVYAISYPSGYPFYPSYLHQPDRLEALISNGRSVKEVRHFHSSSIAKTLQLDNTLTSDLPTHVFELRVSDYKYVAMISDGVHSFFSTDQTTASKRVEQIHLSDVIKELFSFKSLNGAFVARRVKKFMKDCRSKGWQHADDLSIGALYLGGEECFQGPSRV